MYRSAAPIYDLIYAGVGKDYEAETAAILAVAADAGIESGSWLDVACGTGLHLQGIADRFVTTGVDASPDMLAVARRRLAGAALHEGDMRTFDLGETFDVVSCLFSSIGYMLTVPDLHRAVARMAAHVRPGGVLAIEAWFGPEVWEAGRLAHDVVERVGMTVIRASRADRRDRISLIDYHHLVLGPEGIEHITEQHELGLFTHAEYQGAFSAAGLEAERDDSFGTGRGLYVARVPA